MKKIWITLLLLVPFIACTKEQTTPNTPSQEVSDSEIEALKKDIKDLRDKVDALTPSEDVPVVSVSEFEALKKENETLKAQVELLTAGFFEVDGLRFDKNGTLISVPKLEDEVVSDWREKNVKLTTTRTHDAEGRIIEVMNKYSGYNSMNSIPYYWQKTMYEYTGKSCKTTTQTYKSGLAAGTPYEEVITEATYW